MNDCCFLKASKVPWKTQDRIGSQCCEAKVTTHVGKTLTMKPTSPLPPSHHCFLSVHLHPSPSPLLPQFFSPFLSFTVSFLLILLQQSPPTSLYQYITILTALSVLSLTSHTHTVTRKHSSSLCPCPHWPGV